MRIYQRIPANTDAGRTPDSDKWVIEQLAGNVGMIWSE